MPALLLGIANLFDVSVVFVVGPMISLFSVYRMRDLVDPNGEVTMVKTNAQAYRLAHGQVIYLPDPPGTAPAPPPQ